MFKKLREDRRLAALATLVTVLIAVSVVATGSSATRIYYVATDGSGDFTSVAQLNTVFLAPGASVRFRRGDTFPGHGIRAQDGVVYEAYGDGPKPRITNIDGTGFVGANSVLVRDLRITNTTGPAVWIDKKHSLRFERLDFDNTVTGDSDKATFTAFHSDYVTVLDCTFGTSGGNDHLYLFNADHAYVRGNRVTWHGPQDGDGIQIADSDNFYIGQNVVASLGGGKGGIVVIAWHSVHPGGGLVEQNRVTGGQYGIAVRSENVIVQENLIRDVGKQDHSKPWSTALWIATGGDTVSVDGMVFRNNVIVNSRRAIGSWDDLPRYSTGYTIHHNTIVGAEELYFFRFNGSMSGSFHRNLIVDSGRKEISVSQENWRDYDNYYYNVEDEMDTGGDPRLDRQYRVTTVDAVGYGALAAAIAESTPLPSP